jgi:hypothetical protein
MRRTGRIIVVESSTRDPVVVYRSVPDAPPVAKKEEFDHIVVKGGAKNDRLIR